MLYKALNAAVLLTCSHALQLGVQPPCCRTASVSTLRAAHLARVECATMAMDADDEELAPDEEWDGTLPEDYEAPVIDFNAVDDDEEEIAPDEPVMADESPEMYIEDEPTPAPAPPPVGDILADRMGDFFSAASEAPG